MSMSTTSTTTSTRTLTMTGASSYPPLSSSAASTPSLHGNPPLPPLTTNPSTSSLPKPPTSFSGGASSLYQDSLTLLSLLRRIPNFPQTFLDTDFYDNPTPTPPTPSTSTSRTQSIPQFNNTNISSDPVSQLLGCLRLGSSLCTIFNEVLKAMGGGYVEKQLVVNNKDSVPWNLKGCQKSAAHFIMGLTRTLGWVPTEVFSVTQLYEQDTNGTVKVITTVRRLVDELDRLGGLLPPSEDDLQEREIVALDERGKVVKELLESERKYVQDLELLQTYQRDLTAADIISQDTIHRIFMNLNTLVDFQRRFLIGLEAHASIAPDEQRLGMLFVQMEDGFSCYEPFCANFAAAQNLAIQEHATLSQVSHAIEPVHGLPSYLIKPVQRICKYPLFLQQLVKTSDQTSPHFPEVEAALEAVKRCTERVNETKRKVENDAAVEELGHRVEDWKNHDYRTFGALLLEDVFNVIKNDTDREFHVYLFERIILCCKEVGGQGKKGSKSNSMVRKPGHASGLGMGGMGAAGQAKKKNPLQLKGRIFINNVLQATILDQTPAINYGLRVSWRGDSGDESFTLKCRTDEQLRKWQRSIQKAVDEKPNRRTQHLSQSGASSAGSIRRANMNSPLSTFPATPQSEMSHYSVTGDTQRQYAAYAHANGFDADDGDGYGDGAYSDYESTAAGRRNPNARSMPPGARADEGAIPDEWRLRPRAATQDSNSSIINQWRSQTPTGGYPTGMPAPPTRHPSQGYGGPHGAQTYHAHGHGQPSHPGLRTSASSKNLRHKQSQEWGSRGGGYVSGAATPSGDYDDYRDRTPDQLPGPPSSTNVGVGASHGGHGPPPPLTRSRSASSPHVYNPNGAAPPWAQPDVPSVPPLNIPGRGPSSGQIHSGMAANGYHPTPGQLSAREHNKRLSSSSQSAGGNRSSRSSADVSQTTATSPISANPSTTSLISSRGDSPGTPSTSATLTNGNTSNGHLSTSSTTSNSGSGAAAAPVAGGKALKIKVCFGDDTFTLVCLRNLGYAELVDKVVKKIRLCGDRTRIDEGQVRLRYEDDDGDRINISSDDDVAMAFEMENLVLVVSCA